MARRNGIKQTKMLQAWATLHKEVMPEKGVYFRRIASKMLAIHQGFLRFFLILQRYPPFSGAMQF